MPEFKGPTNSFNLYARKAYQIQSVNQTKLLVLKRKFHEIVYTIFLDGLRDNKNRGIS